MTRLLQTAPASKPKKVRKPKKPTLSVVVTPHVCVEKDGVFVMFDGLKTVNELNDHKYWKTRLRRAEAQRSKVKASLANLTIALPAEVLVTRFAPSEGLDRHDGLPASQKHVVDGVADALGIEDNDPRVSWSYAQVKGPYGVQIHIGVARPCAHCGAPSTFMLARESLAAPAIEKQALELARVLELLAYHLEGEKS